MADEKNVQTTENQAAGDAAASESSKKGLNPAIIGVGGAVVGIVIVIILLMFTPLKKMLFGNSHSSAATEAVKNERVSEDKNVIFLPLPEVIVNLKNTGKGRGNILKALFVLELESEKDREGINKFTPLIIDQFQTFLREMEMSDLEGGTGIEKIRQELESRVNQVVSPIKVRKILTKEFLVQ
jgi:flagellar FliL protein